MVDLPENYCQDSYLIIDTENNYSLPTEDEITIYEDSLFKM